MRCKSPIWLILAGVWLAGCEQANQPFGVLGDPADPTNPNFYDCAVDCVYGDPDSEDGVQCTNVCTPNKAPGDVPYDCITDDVGIQTCDIDVPTTPNSTPGWDCELRKIVEENFTLTCSTPGDPTDPVGPGWSCETGHDDVGLTTTCTTSIPVPPGPGTPECVVEEFKLTCTTTPGDPIPPGICFCPSTIVEGWPVTKPLVTISQTQTTVSGTPAIRTRVTLSRDFVDNSYGTTSIGWLNQHGQGRNHKFKDLVGSDHIEVNLCDAMRVKLDYISKAETPSGHDTLGVSGGDGKMLDGSANDVLGVRTALAENFNTHGYVLMEDSPATDTNYTPNAQYPHWDFSVWYEVDVRAAALPAQCGASMDFVHASPAKSSDDTIDLTPCGCP